METMKAGGNAVENQENLEKEVFKDEKKNGDEKKDEENEQSSPRGVFEIPISTSDSSDHSSSIESEISSSSSGSSSFNEKTILKSEFIWRNLFDQIKKKSLKKFPTMSFLGGYEFSKKNFRRKLGRNHSALDTPSDHCADFVAPKPSWKNFSYEELAEATQSFSPDQLVGKGGHAEVYKGTFPDGEVVAVKKITKKQKNDEDRVAEFLSELGIIAHINHPNAAKLIGFSTDTGLHLVLQYLPRGSLSNVIHGSGEDLEWKIRYKVALGVAQGLQYLHCDCQRRIIHRDISASNILLTQDYEPQISDFGLAKWLPEKMLHHVISPIEGTFGYMAPEYFMHGVVHEKTDVFAFGVLLLELITGRRAVDSCRQSLVSWAKPLLEKNSCKELADPRLGDNYDAIEMKCATFTASACIHHLPNMRPNMNKVIQLLKGENEGVEMKQKPSSGRAMLVDACDSEDYTCTTYLNDLNRHMQLVME